MTRHGSIHPRHAVIAFPAVMPLAPATSPTVPKPGQTREPGLYRCLTPALIATCRAAEAHPVGPRADRPANQKPLSP